MVQINETVFVSVKHNAGDEVRILSQDLGLEVLKNLYKVGSSFRNGDVNRGLTRDEEHKLLPDIVGSNPQSQDWNSTVREYWANISATIPVSKTVEGGRKLEVGLEYDTEEDAEKGNAERDSEWEKYRTERERGKEYIMSHSVRLSKGHPINIEDYILYRYLLVYGECANTPEEMNNSSKIRFYLTSEAQRKNANAKLVKMQTKAMEVYLTVINDVEKVANIIAVLKGEQNFIPPKGSELFELQAAISTFMQQNPTRFVDIVNDKQLDAKAFIYKAIAAGVLRRLPNSDVIMYGDNTKLGQNIQQAIDWTQNADNAETLMIIKAQMN